MDGGAYEFYADDPYEFSGVSGSDDEYKGHRIAFGQIESHHHRGVNWAWFSPAHGATTVELEPPEISA